MLLSLVILIGICIVSGAVALWMELSTINDSLIWLEERLTKLEKDAVKVTFTSVNGKVIVHPQVKLKPNPKQFPEIKSEEPFVKTRTKRKPKTVKDWEDQFDLGGNQ